MTALPFPIDILLCLILLLQMNGAKLTNDPFHEVKGLRAKCYRQNRCQKRASTRPVKFTGGFSCSCDFSCSQLGTCCFNSPFRGLNQMTEIATCRSVNGMFHLSFLMIDKCPSAGDTYTEFQKQCEDETSAEIDNSLRVPVTSLSSNLTYKNYFCFRCHEKSGDISLWKAQFTTRNQFDSNHHLDAFLKHQKSTGKSLSLFPSDMNTVVPSEIIHLPRSCLPSLISSCPENWPVNETRRKCGMYMLVGYSNGNYYKNPHCALCNFETLEQYTCMGRKANAKKAFYPTFVSSEGQPYADQVMASYMVIDTNCESQLRCLCHDNEVWDPYRKKCRKLICVLKGYKVERGKCVPQ